MNGADAEARALAHLQGRGLRLVARNFRCKLGELDLVMRDGETLAVVEVRQRSHPGFGGAAESVDRRKQRRIIHATQMFLSGHPQYGSWPLRFDVVALDGAGRVDWIAAAFDAAGF